MNSEPEVGFDEVWMSVDGAKFLSLLRAKLKLAAGGGATLTQQGNGRGRSRIG